MHVPKTSFQPLIRRLTTTVRPLSNNPKGRIVDLRSDTVTQPSQAMLQTALKAPTGDDVMGEDPTVQKLECFLAELFAKERGLFVPTATMANLIATLSHCQSRASQVLMGAHSHMCLWEGGNVAGMGGVHTRQLVEDVTTAQFNLEDVRDAFRTDNDDHFPKTELICLENTHNMLGGVALPTTYVDRIGTLARELGLAVHMDGARIFNAAMAQNVSVKELCQSVDSVSVCLSKGLGAPLGSVLVGTTEFIRLAKRARKRCGGGMRQAGVVAAMGLYAVEHNVLRLSQDHDRAKHLANHLWQHGFRVARHGQVDTNIFYFGLPVDTSIRKDDFVRRLSNEYGVKLTGGYSKGGELFRLVTHFDLSDDDIDYAGASIIKVCYDS